MKMGNEHLGAVILAPAAPIDGSLNELDEAQRVIADRIAGLEYRLRRVTTPHAQAVTGSTPPGGYIVGVAPEPEKSTHIKTRIEDPTRKLHRNIGVLDAILDTLDI